MMTRRNLLGAGMTLATGLGLGLGRVALAAKPWYMPDEHRKQERVFVAYAASPDVWEDIAPDVNATVARLARAIAEFQPVTVLCRPEQQAETKRACAGQNIDFLPVPVDDIWVRDYGGCFLVNDAPGGLALADFNFNGWGGKQHAERDREVSAALAEDVEGKALVSELCGEGGGIEVDGHGTAIFTESCWLNDNRNPGWTRPRIEAELKRMLGLRKVIWLPGIRGKDITDAHVDFYARFVEPGVVVVNLDNDKRSYDYEVTRRHLEILKNATDADGRKLELHSLPPPMNPRPNAYNLDNPDFAAGYINYLPVNGGVIAPKFGDATADEHCHALLSELYPDREVVQLNIDPIAAGGGGIHCVTLQMPAV
ncbi:agmatine/peptidylarginine deiminase [Pseudomonas sp. BGr12]|uniref:agmatine deiminase family protein n=1 Tax=Pseudomonas sp. BGr12 TaxID=2936269 RepID=UPI00385FC08E